MDHTSRSVYVTNYRVGRPIAALLLALATTFVYAQDGAEAERLQKSVVRISARTQTPNFTQPWNPGNTGGGVGTGFIIPGHRIMTNAHVVSNATVLEVKKGDSAVSYEATLEFIAHDCDLAILSVADKAFFKDSPPLEFGGIPKLDTQVTAFGFPIGGSRLSITRGIVSRIEFHTYSHSGLDSHLTIQIDAAINPGNSCGPVIQDGKVVGVAFQAFGGSVAQNTGYMIPNPVIQRMLKDVEDGTYHGYVELAVDYLPLQNPSYRKRLGLPVHGLGVIVTRVMEAGSAHGALQRDDILIGIDGHPISSNGEITLDGAKVQLEEIVERKFHGDIVKFRVIRDGKEMDADVTVKGAWPYKLFSRQYDENPQYVLFAGMLFQRLSRNFMGNYKRSDVELNYFLENFVSKELYKEHPDVVILSQVLPDPINAEVRHMVFKVVDTVNGEKIRTMSDFAKALDTPAERYVIEMTDESRPIVIEAARLAEAQARILERYNIQPDRQRYLGEAGK
jgi:S1-C subfamily serine protease